MKGTVFVCDNCKKEINTFEGGFPYKKGWVYGYKFAIKISDKKKNRFGFVKEAMDKHFCCEKCMIKHFTEFAKE